MSREDSFSWHPIMRSILDHWVWREKPFSKGQAWVDLILLAQHGPTKKLIGGVLFNLEAGQLAMAKSAFSVRWGWSRDKVERFVKMLEEDAMISQQTSQQTTVFTLLNYKELREQAFSRQGNGLNNGQGNGQGNAQGNDKATDKAQYKKERIKEGKKEEIKTKGVDADDLPSTPDPENLEATKATLRAAVACALLENPDFSTAWDAFLKMRKDMKAPAGEEAQKRLLRKLESYPVETAIRMVDESTMNSWKGVFPLKEAHGQAQNTGRGQRADFATAQSRRDSKADREYPEQLDL